ncbi:MAG: DUF615 domain-containing protein [Rhodocyclaceae bacterium]|nr:DUF615 domain-containing protein [Rhodocyclaceae bacterium]
MPRPGRAAAKSYNHSVFRTRAPPPLKPESTSPPPDKPSKTRLKRAMHELQDMGSELVELSPERLAKIHLPDALLEAIRAAQQITKHEARRRQLQYIGRLMRAIDAEPIRAALAELHGTSRAEAARVHALERLRERLLENEAVLADIAASHPGADLQRLRQLRRNALKEQEAGKPPRAFRELFRELRALQNDTETTHDQA